MSGSVERLDADGCSVVAGREASPSPSSCCGKGVYRRDVLGLPRGEAAPILVLHALDGFARARAWDLKESGRITTTGALRTTGLKVLPAVPMSSEVCSGSPLTPALILVVATFP